MKRKEVTLLLILSLASAACERGPEPTAASEPVQQSVEEVKSYAIPGVLYVKFDDSLLALVEEPFSTGEVRTRSSALDKAMETIGIKSAARLFPFDAKYEARTRKAGLHRWYKVEYDTDVMPKDAASLMVGIKGVMAARPQLRATATTIPFNDPMAGKQWHYENASVTYADVNIVPVWENYGVGSDDVIVSVIDSGVDLEHEDLAWNAVPCGENGSRSFLYDNPGYTILPDSHGTHVAGTIAAVNDNGIGVCGIAGGDFAKGIRGARIMSCQIMHARDDGTTAQGDAETALKWAADHGAVIANNSWGYEFYQKDGVTIDMDVSEYYHNFFEHPNEGFYADPLKDAIDYFNEYAGTDPETGEQTGPMKGGLVFFAAGNQGIRYGAPAGYPGAVAVGSIAQSGIRSSFSNYGDWVDICAPGGESYNILSTIPGNEYASLAGTSMACPHVAGVAALVLSVCGGVGFTREDLLAKLLGGGNTMDFSTSYKIGPLADAMGAVEYNLDAVPPTVAGYSASANSNTITFEIPVPAATPRVYGFKLFISKSPDLSDARTEFLNIDGKVAGEVVSARVEGLDFQTDYYVSVAACNAALKEGETAAVKSLATGINHAPTITTDYAGSFSVMPFNTLSVEYVIEDPDGHDFTCEFKRGSSAESFTEASANRYVFEVDGTKAPEGTYTATITVKDSYGLSTVKEITYTILPDNPPVITAAIDNLLLESKGSSIGIDLSGHISDPDGEELAFTISNTGANKTVSTTLSGKILTITAIVEYGTTSVTVTGTDACGKSISTTFNVLIRPAGENVTCYPIPVINEFFVATGLNEEEAHIRIISTSGQTVLDERVSCSAFDPAAFDLSGFAPGRYSLMVEYSGNIYKNSIVKK